MNLVRRVLRRNTTAQPKEVEGQPMTQSPKHNPRDEKASIAQQAISNMERDVQHIKRSLRLIETQAAVEGRRAK
jgi:hypothetical protein